ncbi:putative TMP_2 domain-containing protein [Gammaproteobacteria bacterium]
MDENQIGLQAVLDDADFVKGSSDYIAKMGEMDSETSSASSGMAGGFSIIDGAILELGAKITDFAFGAMKDLVGAIGSFITEASDAERGQVKLATVINSTGGAAGITAEDVNALATAYQNTTEFTDDAVVSASSVLLKYTSLGKDVFPNALQATLDMAAAMGTDAAGAAQALGMAMEDPVGAAGKLKRAGVMLTDEQKDMIKTMVDAGDQAGAQQIILDAVAKSVGGTAAAMGDTFGGKLTIFNNQMDNMKESIGNAIIPALTPLIGTFTDLAMNVLPPLIEQFTAWLQPALTDLASTASTNLVPALMTVADWVTGTLVPVLQTVWTWIATNLPPAITALANFWTTTLYPALVVVGDWMTTTLFPAMQVLFDWLATNLPPAISALANFWTTTLLPAIMAVAAWVTGTLIPTLTTIWTWIATTLPPAIQTLADFWTLTLQPALLTVYDWINTYLVPIFVKIGELFNVTLTLAITALTKVWNEDLLPALTKIWDYISTNLNPIFEKIGTILSVTVGPAIGDFVKNVLGALETTLGSISKKIQDVIDWVQTLIDKLSGVSIPPAIMGNSPSPFEVSLVGIADALGAVTSEVGKLNTGFSVGPIAGGAGGGSSVSNNSTLNLNMPTTVNGQMDVAFLQALIVQTVRDAMATG